MRMTRIGWGLILLAVAVASQPALAGKLSTLHSFCAATGCPDGSQPHEIVLDRHGNLIGPTFTGEDDTLAGTMFEVQPNGRRFKVLHTFCSDVKRHCRDGSFAFSAPVLDANGNLFGGTEHGGMKDDGIVYELTPHHGGYGFKVIYSFCKARGCPDGRGSDGTYAVDAAGNVYGTTFDGGAHHGGVLFELSPSAGAWTYKVLYDFCSQKHCADGKSPLNGVTYAGAAAGIPYDGVSPLYGATGSGGTKDNEGVVYQFTPGAGEKVLYTFCRSGRCSGGGNPAEYGALALDGAGNIYGATQSGGMNFGGVIYKLAPTDSGEWSETVLQELCPSSGCGGQWVVANPKFDASGNLIGTTNDALYKLDMTGATPTLETLYTFCSLANCADGEDVENDIVIDSAGIIYGTTTGGGAGNSGTIFAYKP